jgi:excisionase family DNA binding protein
MVMTEEAARIANVSVRTIRRWVQQGHLPYVENERGKLVSPADLSEAKQRAGRGQGRGHKLRVPGHDRGHEATNTDTDTAMTASALSSTTAQMELIRDQWLRPFVDRIEELSRENGRLEQERDTLRDQLAAIQRQDVPPSANSASPSDDLGPQVSTAYGPVSDSLALTWRRWWRRITGTE